MRLAAVIAAGLLAVACRVDQGSGDYDHTLSGYMLFNNANNAMQEFSKAIDRLQGLDLYIGAEDEATREAIRNRFFLDKRLVPDAEHEGVWLIISDYATLEIDTGRKRLGDEGAVWSYAYLNGKYDASSRPTLRRTAPGTYSLNVPAPADPGGEFIYAEADDIGVRIDFEPDDPLEGYSDIRLSGSFTSVCGHGHDRLVMEVDITDEVTYSGKMNGMTGGTMQLDATSRGSADKATARYLTPNTVDIEYDGSASTWIY